ncbi:MAG TPA: hypothetical protein VFW23_17845 [Tepidisphaeraceae bacterium]|nr:hypothetical protein [Tepidisphaeraceae bacterium]
MAADNDFPHAIQSLVNGDFGQTHRYAIDNVVLRGSASELVQAAFTRVRRAGGDDKHAVQHLMTSLEVLTEISPLTARILMATLWPVASQLLLHEVCDAIDLWIVNEMSDVLRHRLRQMMESEHEESSRRHLERLLQNET